MIKGKSDLIADLEILILRKQPFAVYRIPGEKSLCLLVQTQGEVRMLSSIKELNEQTGFVIAPFRENGECPVVLIQPDIIDNTFILEETDALEPVQSMVDKESVLQPICCSEQYSACFDTFISALRNRTFDKLVLSRSLVVDKPENFSPLMAFYKACQWYIHSYVYLCYTPQTGIWLGSTPEVILAGEKGEWNTVALAGTQPLQNGKLPQIWDDKNRREQEYVTSYIRNQLCSLGIHPTEQGPYPAYAGALSHLKTDFHFSLNDSKGLGDLLALLHPTPAVCGLPKEEAYQFILKNEGYDRKYYSGFIGWLDPEGKTDLYVNLRCMHIGDNVLTLYAGGGLLASSELNDEWQETEKKLQTMKRIN